MFSEILFLIMIIVLNAFFAASEIALHSLNNNKVRLMAKEGNKKTDILKKLLAEPSRFLATIQICIKHVGFLAIAFAAESFLGNLFELIKQTGVAFPDVWLNNASVVITIFLIYFTIVLGELVLKRLAMMKAESISMFVVDGLNFLFIMTFLFVKLLTLSTNFFKRPLKDIFITQNRYFEWN